MAVLLLGATACSKDTVSATTASESGGTSTTVSDTSETSENGSTSTDTSDTEMTSTVRVSSTGSMMSIAMSAPTKTSEPPIASTSPWVMTE